MCLLIVLGVLISFPIQGAFGLPPKNGSSGVEEKVVPAPGDEFASLWDERLDLIKQGRGDEAAAVIDRIILGRLEKGISNLQTYSAAILLEAEDMAEGGDVKGALNLVAQARDLAPDYYGPLVTERRVLFSENRVFEAIEAFSQSLCLKYEAFTTGYPAVYNKVSIILISYYWLTIIFALMLLFQYVNLAAHDIMERVPGFDQRGALIMALVVAVFPATFTPNLLLYALLLMLLMWIYLSNRQRIIAALLGAFILVMPFPLRVVSNGLAASNEAAFDAVRQVREGRWDDHTVKVLEKAATDMRESPAKENVLLSLAKTLTYNGQYEEALTRLDEIDPSSELAPLVTLQRGNIYFLWKKYPEALRWFAEAVNQMPENAIAHFNLWVVLSRSEIIKASADSVNRAQIEIEKVKELAPVRIETWTSYQELDPEIYVVDMPLPIKRLWQDIWTITPQRKAASNEMLDFLTGGLSITLMMVAAGAFLILALVLTFVEQKFEHAKRCRICNMPICSRCKPQGVSGDICSRCKNVFESKTGLDPRTRERLRAEIRSKRHRVILAGEIISVLVPGCGHLLVGKSLRGTIMTFISLLIITSVVYSQGILRSRWFVPGTASTALLVGVGIIYLAYVAVSTWNVSQQN